MTVGSWNGLVRVGLGKVVERFDALRFALRGSPGDTTFRAYLLAFSEGRFEEARAALDAAITAAPDHAPFRFARVYLARFGLIGLAPVVGDLEHLRRDRRAAVRLRADIELANLLWEREGTTRPAVEAARSVLKHAEAPARHALRMIALIAASGRSFEAVDHATRLARRAPDVVEATGYLELCRVLRKENRLNPRHGERAERIAERLDADAGRFARRVEEAGPDDLAIVGNGPSELRTGHGRIIDSRRLVVRFNNFYDSRRLTVDYGERADVWFRSGFDGEVLARPLEGIGEIVVLGSDPRNRFSEGVELFDRWAESAIAVEVTPFPIYKRLYSVLDASPSSGLVGLFWAYHILGRISGKSVFGFAAHLNSERQATYADHNVSVKTPGRHNWHAEELLISSLMNEWGDT